MAEALRVVGQSVPRSDAYEKVTGAARFTGDLWLPGMLYGKMLRSPYAHARIVSIDTSKAEKVKGVRAVLTYKDVPLKHTYEPDFICFDRIIVEIKAVSQLTDAHRAQVHNYLKATGYKLGLLVNFGHYPKLEYERIVR